MVKTIILLLVVAFICLYEVPKMKKQGMKKEIVVFSLFLGLGTVLYSLELNGVDIPNPLEGLRAVFSQIGLKIDSYFQG